MRESLKEQCTGSLPLFRAPLLGASRNAFAEASPTTRARRTTQSLHHDEGAPMCADREPPSASRGCQTLGNPAFGAETRVNGGT
jgi:hypothetical protein